MAVPARRRHERPGGVAAARGLDARLPATTTRIPQSPRTATSPTGWASAAWPWLRCAATPRHHRHARDLLRRARGTCPSATRSCSRAWPTSRPSRSPTRGCTRSCSDSERRYRYLLRTRRTSCGRSTSDGRFTFLTDAVEQVTGCPPRSSSAATSRSWCIPTRPVPRGRYWRISVPPFPAQSYRFNLRDRDGLPVPAELRAVADVRRRRPWRRARHRARPARAGPPGGRPATPGGGARLGRGAGPAGPGAARLGDPGAVQHDAHHAQRRAAGGARPGRRAPDAGRAARARAGRARRDARAHLRAAAGRTSRRTAWCRRCGPTPPASRAGRAAHPRRLRDDRGPRAAGRSRTRCTASPRRRSTTSSSTPRRTPCRSRLAGSPTDGLA